MSAQDTPDRDPRDTPAPSVSDLLAACAAARTLSTPPADLTAEENPAEEPAGRNPAGKKPAERRNRDAA
jgi:hypothetical protein